MDYDFLVFVFFFFKQKTAYEMVMSDWSSDVCSSDLGPRRASGRQRILRERRRHFVGLAPWAVLAERSPEQARGESERSEAREHRKVDAQVKAAHQSCDFANR